jgi:hypothetical protein
MSSPTISSRCLQSSHFATCRRCSTTRSERKVVACVRTLRIPQSESSGCLKRERAQMLVGSSICIRCRLAVGWEGPPSMSERRSDERPFMASAVDLRTACLNDRYQGGGAIRMSSRAMEANVPSWPAAAFQQSAQLDSLRKSIRPTSSHPLCTPAVTPEQHSRPYPPAPLSPRYHSTSPPPPSAQASHRQSNTPTLH